ncbi:TPA: hypothetical protein ACGO1J_001472 [Streptococcus suis]
MLAIVTLPIAIPVLLILLGALVALVLLIIGFIMGDSFSVSDYLSVEGILSGKDLVYFHMASVYSY